MFSALLLLSLVLCTSCFYPPVVNISLDDPPEVRWAPLLKVFDVTDLNKAAAEVIDSTVPKWVHHALAPVVVALDKYIPSPYAGEIRGMASHFGATLSDIIILNFAYEISAFCTSIVAQDTSGHVYHGRNLDYPHDVLRNLTINIIFLKNGEVAYRGTSFAGYVGLWTGQSPNKFTVSGDQRVAGVRGGEGVVITRDRQGPADIWPLDPLNGRWYRVETNFDHWLPPPSRDHRRDIANKALNATGQENINIDTLFQVLSVYPVCNGMTVYTTTMSAAFPDNYTSVIRPQGCHWTDSIV
ncbi:N-acylethanolamine-hydrolyzing acid amidase-like isoform X2 [Hypomesus transpacificus]|uniref:N-acylethanolamine-hydrolyzing acid amidase-like isoform X2 n=1 Tax=Hypomesus transpacificus TaxID=137520 RepID=UPI001F0812D6|nr:N-acylethanolamine-hydrolyzing acid amidase-like isoform X2 [Hypomesus transpacificus]